MTDHNLKKLLPLGTSLLRGTTFTDTITRKGKSHLRRTQIGDRVSVYRNLHLDNKFSIRAMDGEYRSKVMGYATCIILEEINFFVGKGIHKARAEKQRNVHAFVRGRFLDAKDTAIELPDNMVEITLFFMMISLLKKLNNL